MDGKHNEEEDVLPVARVMHFRFERGYDFRIRQVGNPCEAREMARPTKRLFATRPRWVHAKAHLYPISVPSRFAKTDDSFIDWSVTPTGPLRLYVHIPWCLGKCTFCHYNSVPRRPDDEEFGQYVACLLGELQTYRERLGLDELVAETLYVGGGTPSILEPQQIQKLLDGLHQEVSFVNDATLATEVSPGTLTPKRTQAFLSGGINRVSMGVQSLNDRILLACGRDHDSAQVECAYSVLRDAGVQEINFDLILGLPGQTTDDFAGTLEKVLRMGPTSLTFSDFRLSPKSRLAAEGYEPDWHAMIAMRATYQDVMGRDGRYVRTRPHYYVIPEQSRSGTTRVPFLDTRPGPGFQLGIGASACSHLGDVIHCKADYPRYLEMYRAGRLPVTRALRLTEEDKTTIKVIRAIVDNVSIPRDPEVTDMFGDRIQFLRKHGLIDEDWRLTDDGCLFGEEVVYLFYPGRDAILRTGEQNAVATVS